ncbi:hypothetical protein F0562_007662 [Nyssa sinensis]|uniref:Protein FAR1-RELATED SEQUENCE n=1 Tax=Nyssa sinensis TaxID=561372 RepID=A0A5J5A8T9_9ASTE|nr:hypothetical protein F0562_007662 [Nyssa sinensis]
MEEDALSSSSSMEVVEEQKENEMEIVNLEDKVEASKIGMTFSSYDELYDYYIRYAKQLGFAICKRSSTKGDDGELKYITLACSRSGHSQHTSKNIFRPHPITKTNCQAKIRAIAIDGGSWQVNSLSLDHNHGLSPGKARFYRCNRVMRPYVKRKLEMNDKAGIRMNKSYNACVVEAGGHENMTFLEKDCRNYIEKVRRLQLGQGDAAAVQDYFLKMQADNANFFYAMDLDEKARLKNLFWADARSRAAYEEFGDVVTFDTTYLTNKYDMPFAPFVGVNHHGHSILLGCGLISNEDTDTFTWLFQTWLTCMSGRAPSGIITDQDKAMKKAIEKVLPNTRHRWCLWHIMKKIPEKLKGYKDYESIKFILQKAVYDTLSPNEFECSWNLMIEKYKLHGNEWLLGMYTERHRWVPAFVKDNFWAGMSTTQRSESMHAFFDGYVNVKTTLKQFVEQYENALKDKVQKETQEDFNCFNSWLPCITHYDMEKQFADAYTTAKFKEFQMELTGKIYCSLFPIKEDGSSSEYKVLEDVKIGDSQQRVNFMVLLNGKDCEVKCNCRLFESRGILCRHAIVTLLHNKVYRIPERYIMRRWRKDVKRCHTRVQISYSDYSAKAETKRFDSLCNSFHEVADMASESEDKFNLVMTWIAEMKNNLKHEEGICGSNQTTSKVSTENNSVGEHHGISNESKNILTPLAVRSKGRPPFKRKQSKVEQIVKKRKEKKKEMVSITNNVNEGGLKDFEKFKSMGIGHIEGPTAYNVANIIGTQDSIVVNPSFQGHRDANMPNYTPQIMLGVDVATNVNLMQGNLNLHGYSRTPPTNLSVDYPSGDSDHVTKRRAMGLLDELNMPVNILPVSFPGHALSQAFNAPDDLPKTVAKTLNQGSTSMSMDFHPLQ